MPGTLFIVTAPSGAGKTTLVSGLLARDPLVKLSVSYATRAPRAGEVDGTHYHFVDVPTFRALRDKGEFLEWAEVHSNYYGTSRAWLEAQIAAGNDILLEIDWQGAQQVRKVFPKAVGVFILPPSVEELERRLRGRGTEDEAIVARRLAAASAEMRRAAEFDYAIINSDFSDALARLQAVVTAARQRVAQVGRRERELFAHFGISIE